MDLSQVVTVATLCLPQLMNVFHEHIMPRHGHLSMINASSVKPKQNGVKQSIISGAITITDINDNTNRQTEGSKSKYSIDIQHMAYGTKAF